MAGTTLSVSRVKEGPGRNRSGRLAPQLADYFMANLLTRLILSDLKLIAEGGLL